MTRRKRSKSTKPVYLSDLVKKLPANAVVQVGSTWLKKVEDVYNVVFLDPNSPELVTPVESPEELFSASESEGEPRERVEISPEDL